MIDEVQQARVGEVVVLEHHDHRRSGGQPFEEGAPGSEQLLGAHARADTQERQQGRLDPAPLRFVRDMLRDGRGDLRPGRGGVVGLQQPASTTDHLAQCPEADALAIRGRAAVVPPDLLDQAIEVLRELPGQAGLADARRPDDRDEAGAPFPAGGVEQVLEQPELVIAPDEGCLEGVRAALATAFGNDPKGAPRGDRGGLALELPIADRLEGDGATRGAFGGLPHQDSCRASPPTGGATRC